MKTNIDKLQKIVNDVLDKEHELTSSSKPKHIKGINMKNGFYIVYLNEVQIYKTQSLKLAVHEFNKL